MSLAIRYATFVETLAFAGLVALFIWKWQTAHPLSWIIFPVWLVVSFLVHRDTPKTLGWRADNFWATTQLGLPFFSASIVAIVVAGIALGALHRMPDHLINERRVVGYFAFCVLQQVTMNSYVMNRLLAALGNEHASRFVAAVIFAAVHWPNPVLVPITFIGGYGMCFLFASQRNILPLILGQAILGGLIWWAFPPAWHHGMRVGPGFYSYAQRLVTW